MFNLLPKTEKEKIRREYRTRLAVVILTLLCATLAISSILLLPAFLLSSEKEESAEQRFGALTKSVERGNAAHLDEVLGNAKSRLALFKREDPALLLHELLMEVVSVKTDRISLTNFSFLRSGEGKREMRVAGVARDRSALLAFIKALERTELFEKVEVPISDFAKDVDIDFSVQAVGIF